LCLLYLTSCNRLAADSLGTRLLVCDSRRRAKVYDLSNLAKNGAQDVLLLREFTPHPDSSVTDVIFVDDISVGYSRISCSVCTVGSRHQRGDHHSTVPNSRYLHRLLAFHSHLTICAFVSLGFRYLIRFGRDCTVDPARSTGGQAGSNQTLADTEAAWSEYGSDHG